MYYLFIYLHVLSISLYEISIALKQLKNNKALRDDGTTAELKKAGGQPVFQALEVL